MLLRALVGAWLLVPSLAWAGGGWYLLLPPLRAREVVGPAAPGRVPRTLRALVPVLDKTTPLNEWQHEGAYDSATACEAAKQAGIHVEREAVAQAVRDQGAYLKSDWADLLAFLSPAVREYARRCSVPSSTDEAACIRMLVRLEANEEDLSGSTVLLLFVLDHMGLGLRFARAGLDRAEVARCVASDDPRLGRAGVPAGPPPSPAAPPRRDAPDTRGTTATGFVVSKHGHAVTAAHAVEGCREIRSRTAAGDESRARLLARDPKNDVALLGLAGHPPLTAAAFRAGGAVRLGDQVVALGFPLPGWVGSGLNLTTGTISALAGPRDDPRVLQLTAPIQPGHSGGPLLDQSGHVVGMLVAKLDALKVAEATGDIPQNVNFAIHAGVIRAFLNAQGVPYDIAGSYRPLEAADIGARATRFTVVVECVKKPPQ